MKEFKYFIKYFIHYCWLTRGVIVILMSIIFIFGLAFSYIENVSVSDSIYFIFISALTIGYGDITPTTIATKIIAVFSGLIGLIFFGLIVAIATLALKSAIQDIKKHMSN